MPRAPIWLHIAVHTGIVALFAPVLAVLAVALRFRAWENEGRLQLVLMLVAASLVAALWAGRRLARLLYSQRSAQAALAVGLTALAIAGWRANPAHPTPGPGKRVAVIGGGSGGTHAAWLLDRLGADVTLFEAAPYLGGHAQTFVYDDANGHHLPVDMGFIFGPLEGYEEFKAMLAWYEIPRVRVTLDVTAEGPLGTWHSGDADLPDEVRRFERLAAEQYEDPSLNLVPFDAWLDEHDFDQDFRDTYLTPSLILLFITDVGMYQTSTRFMLAMMAGPRQWLDYDTGGEVWAVDGGSHIYYRRMLSDLPDVRLLSPVSAVERTSEGVVVRYTDGASREHHETFDEVVLAVPANVARRLLVDRTWFEDAVLGQVRYTNGEVLLHTDPSAMPGGPEHERSYRVVTKGAVEVHSLPEKQLGATAPTLDPRPYATLNPQREYDNVLFRRTWKHYSMDLWHLATVLKVLPRLQGAGGIHYAGDWVTFIGHGPAMRTGMAAACRIAGTTPREDLSTDGCRTVTLLDPSDRRGTIAREAEFCGERGLTMLITSLACASTPRGDSAGTESQ